MRMNEPITRAMTSLPAAGIAGLRVNHNVTVHVENSGVK
jgi:hypothetical protein